MSEFNKLSEEVAHYGRSLKKLVSDDSIIYNEDSLHVMRRILDKHSDGCFDMIFADPPYFYPIMALPAKTGKWFPSIKVVGINLKVWWRI